MKPRLATEADLAAEAQAKATERQQKVAVTAKAVGAILGCVILAETVALQTLGVAALIKVLHR